MSNKNFGAYSALGTASAASHNKKVREQAIANYKPKPCQNCGELMSVRENESPCDRKKRKYCSGYCSKKGYWNNQRKLQGGKIKRKHIAGMLISKVPFKTIAEVRRTIIADYAQKVFEAYYPIRICELCGYNKHREVAHIKAVATFPKDTLILIVNQLNNLIGLCPNCHWEFDKGLIPIDLINKKVLDRSLGPLFT